MAISKFFIIPIILIFILIYCIIFYVIFRRDKSRHILNEFNYKDIPVGLHTKIPKVIYTFWHDDNLPQTVIKCVKSWKKHNPNYTIIILSYTNIDKYVDKDTLLLLEKWQSCRDKKKRIYSVRNYYLAPAPGNKLSSIFLSLLMFHL